MSNWIILPLLIPLLTGVSALLRQRPWRRRAFFAGVSLNLAVCLLLFNSAYSGTIQVSQMGGHPAPYGISLVVDALTATMLLVTAVVMFAVMLFSFVTIDTNRERFAFFPLMAFLLMGVNFAFLTGDLFTLYVAFEVMLMASFVLLTLGGERGQIEGGIKYVTLNLISSTVFLVAAGLTYTVAGTLNIAHLSERLAGLPAPGITTVLAALFLVAFGVKAAIFPLFFWLPASYHTPPIAVTAFFGGILTKIGIYAILRVLVMVFPQDLIYLQPVILLIAAITMVTGVLGAIAQNDVRRLLSFHIISQIGYLLLGIGLLTELSFTGVVFFVVHVILAKTALFFVSGVADQLQGSYHLKKLGGLQKVAPGLALLFLLAALSLGGIPPLSGFWAKFIIIRAALEAEQYLVTVVALVVSLLTLFSMVKIWNEMFWKPKPNKQVTVPPVTRATMRAMQLSTAILVALVVLIGVFVEPLYSVSDQAASHLVEPSTYVSAVLRLPEVTSNDVLSR